MNTHRTDMNNIFVIPFFAEKISTSIQDFKTTLIGTPTMLCPSISLGYVGRWNFNKWIEINFDAFMSTPYLYLYLINQFLYPLHYSSAFTFPPIVWAPDMGISIGFKRNIKSSDTESISYKFNVGVDFSGDLNAIISFKNSFLFGRKKEKLLLSFIPFINSYNKFGYTSLFDGLWLGLIPGLEITSKTVGKTGLAFTYSFIIAYNMEFLYVPVTTYYLFLYRGQLILGFSWGIGSLKKSKNFISTN